MKPGERCTTTVPASLRGIGKFVGRLRIELVERSAHPLGRGGMRRVCLRGLENIRKRYLIHVAGFNLGLLMRKLIGYGTPKRAADELGMAFVMVKCDCVGIVMFIFLISDHESALLAES